MYIAAYKQKIKSSLLNYYTDWKNLPWQQIQLRISRIMKQIFIASKKHNLIYVYKLQNYLLNCNEIKVLLIDQILLKITLYYTNYKNIQLLVKKIDKFRLLYTIFNEISKKSGTFYIIVEHIKQTLICLSIKPSWNARIAKCSYKLNQQSILNLSINKKTLCYELLIAHIIKKLVSYNYLDNSISNFIYNKRYFYLSNLYNLNYKKFIKQNEIDNNILGELDYSSLSNLINKVILHDLYWYNFSYIKNNNLSNQLNKDSLFNETNQNVEIKLYSKITEYNIINSYLSKFIQRKMACKILSILSSNKKFLVSIRNIQNYNNLVNIQIHRLAKNNMINDKNFLKTIYAIYRNNSFFYTYNIYTNYNVE